jgi:hypothetical protein
MLRGAVLSAGIAAGLFAIAPSAYSQSYWNGVAPTTPGPSVGTDYGYGYGADAAPAGGWGPNWGGWAPEAGGNNVPGMSTPYWLGAPQALGPG